MIRQRLMLPKFHGRVEDFLVTRSGDACRLRPVESEALILEES